MKLDASQAGQSAANSAASDIFALTNSEVRAARLMPICIFSLLNALDDIAEALHVATMSALVTREMKNKGDAEVALEITKIVISDIEKHLPANREIVGSIAGRCPNNPLVDVKVQATLDFLTEIDANIGPIAKRIGVSRN